MEYLGVVKLYINGVWVKGDTDLYFILKPIPKWIIEVMNRASSKVVKEC